MGSERGYFSTLLPGNFLERASGRDPASPGLRISPLGASDKLKLILLIGGVMSDGREERKEREARIQQDKREDREDRIDRDELEQWEPERVDS
jgi:hypothetical protein